MISKVSLFVCEKANYPELFKTGGKKKGKWTTKQSEGIGFRKIFKKKYSGLIIFSIFLNYLLILFVKFLSVT